MSQFHSSLEQSNVHFRNDSKSPRGLNERGQQVNLMEELGIEPVSSKNGFVPLRHRNHELSTNSSSTATGFNRGELRDESRQLIDTIKKNYGESKELLERYKS